MTELPADAYNEVKTALSANPVAPSGVTPQTIETAAGAAYYTVETGKDGANTVRRYSMMLSGGTFSGYVAMQVVPWQVSPAPHCRTLAQSRQKQQGSFA